MFEQNSGGDKTAAVELSAEITLAVALLHIHYSIFFKKNHAKIFEIFYFFERRLFFMDTENQFLGTERIGKLISKYAVPCVILLPADALYNIVDRLVIANASYLGSCGNTANTVVFPFA